MAKLGPGSYISIDLSISLYHHALDLGIPYRESRRWRDYSTSGYAPFLSCIPYFRTYLYYALLDQSSNCWSCPATLQLGFCPFSARICISTVLCGRVFMSCIYLWAWL